MEYLEDNMDYTNIIIHVRRYLKPKKWKSFFASCEIGKKYLSIQIFNECATCLKCDKKCENKETGPKFGEDWDSSGCWDEGYESCDEESLLDPCYQRDHNADVLYSLSGRVPY